MKRISLGLGERPAPVALLSVQALAHGLLCAFTIIPAAGIFLASFGPERLPYVYLLVGAAGIVAAPSFARALSRWPVAAVARPVLAGLAAVQLGCWVLLTAGDVAWPSVVLQVLFPLSLQIGFVLVGTQSGRLLTIQQTKAWFSAVAAWFSVGFLVAGVVAPLVIGSSGGTQHVLLLAATATLAMLVAIDRTGRRWPDELTAPTAPPRRAAVVSGPTGAVPDRSISSLLRLLLAFQVLSALGTQFADYLLYDRAAARFETSEDLARFTSYFNVVLYLVQLVFVFVFAGPLIKRFGVRFGLLANPVVLGAVAAVALAVGSAGGVGSVALFVTFWFARIGDITLTNSTTRTAINATYQALPQHLRAAAQARTEGIGVPAAIGLSGAGLLVLVQLLDRGVLTVAGVTVGICVAWAALGLVVFARYGRRLNEALGERSLAPYPEVIPDSRATRVSGIAAVARDLEAELDDPLRRHDALRSLRRDPERLATLIEKQTGGPDESRRLVWLLRCCTKQNGALAAAVIGRLGHPSRHVAAVAARQLATVLPPDDARRPMLAQSIVGSAASDGAEIVDALARIPDEERFRPLRDALDDEAGWAADRVLSAVALGGDPKAIARARDWLAGSDERLVATALEAIEVNAPPALRQAAVAVLLIRHDPPAAARGLRTAAGDPAGPDRVDAMLADLADDPLGRWNSPWIALCARHALYRSS